LDEHIEQLREMHKQSGDKLVSDFSKSFNDIINLFKILNDKQSSIGQCLNAIGVQSGSQPVNFQQEFSVIHNKISALESATMSSASINTVSPSNHQAELSNSKLQMNLRQGFLPI
jgi:hypothetical protein